MTYNLRGSVLDRMVLNTVQREAVHYDDGPELVFAGAGTGKTRVLTAKIAYLIEKGVHPGQIFAATFTNKAAREMRSRIGDLISIPVEGLWIGTFHSLCARILRREAKQINYAQSFSIFDSNDQVSLIRKVLKSLEIDDRSMPPKQVLGSISRYKNSCITPEELEVNTTGYYEQEILRVYKSYQKALREQQAMDFDDLLSNTVYLFRRNEQVRASYQDLFRYVLVDEYQDTNAVQFQFLKMLSRKHGKVFAVGDDDQSIYGWRGAQIENILSFEREFPGTKVFKLEQNYRSTKAILDFANAAIIENQYRASKQLWTDRAGGEQVVICRFRDDRQEAQNIAQSILMATGNGKIRNGDIAILFRTNAQSRTFEEALRKHKIPFILVGGTGFYERAEIKDCLAYLRLLVNQKDDISFDRIYNVPARGLGEKAYDTLRQCAQDLRRSMLETLLLCDIPSLGNRYVKGFSDLRMIFELLIDLVKTGTAPYEILKQALQLSGYIDMLSSDDTEESSGRIENINELVNALALWSQENPSKQLSDFLEEVSLVSDVDSWDQKENSVNLMTLHCAKGLEFKYVFLVGIEEGILPSRQNLDDEAKLEEERRLLYVGATRAMERLQCSHVDQRLRFGDIIPSAPSRFLKSIPKDLFSFIDNSSYFGQIPSAHEKSRTRVTQPAGARFRPREESVPKYDEFSQETVEFRMGQHINHKMYGRGRILSISGFGDDMKLTVLFNDGARRKLMAKFASIE